MYKLLLSQLANFQRKIEIFRWYSPREAQTSQDPIILEAWLLMEVLLCVCYRPRLVGDLDIRHGTGVRHLPPRPVPHPLHLHPGGSPPYTTVLLLALRVPRAAQALLHPLRRSVTRLRRRRRGRLRRGSQERPERRKSRLSVSAFLRKWWIRMWSSSKSGRSEQFFYRAKRASLLNCICLRL